MELEKGKIYQVKHWSRGWILAEYKGHMDARIVTGFKDLTCRTATKWKEPAVDHWTAVGGGGSFGIRTKDLEVRPASEESLAEIGRIRAEMEVHRKAMMASVKALREFAG